ncbi:hypothetical protein E2C01_010837 [Portunus trituberculatus]|uniref:Uncharacterized protein n=1 Tax=Portunus trituberculatus TaxID=210409 RepID=A0A5B7D9Y5_PORTR|nr:hypothetical protein [Portunus trituberculatus]
MTVNSIIAVDWLVAAAKNVWRWRGVLEVQGKAYLTRVTRPGQATPTTPAARPARRCRCKAPVHLCS